MKRAFWWAQLLLFACGFSLLAFTGWAFVDSWQFQKEESRNLASLSKVSAKLVPAEAKLPAYDDGVIGRVEIARLDISAFVMEGTSSRTLRRAVGHIEGTARQGQVGNIGIAGHRDTFFRPLRNVRESDVIVFRTLTGDYRYRVVSAKIVAPDDVGVLDAGTREILTLVTCYPFYFIGPAPNRFVVRAERVI
jgi:sortase A